MTACTSCIDVNAADQNVEEAARSRCEFDPEARVLTVGVVPGLSEWRQTRSRTSLSPLARAQWAQQ